MSSRGEGFRDAVLAYKYSSPTLSVLERLYLNDFWARVAELYPRWLAPNVITLTGCALIWLAFGLTITGSPTLMGELPPAMYAVNAALFFGYQTLDGSDGKQARRTGSGSALGELMDHGVDAVVTTLVALLVTDVFRFGILSVWPWSFVLVALLSFFLSNMTLVHSGRQKFFDLDVMEIQTVMIITLLVAAVFGTDVFGRLGFPVPEALRFKTDLGGLLKPGEEIDFTDGVFTLKDVVVFGGLGGCSFNYPQYLWASFKPYFLAEEDRPAHVRKGVTGSGLGALLFHLFLIHAFIALAAACVFVGSSLPQARAESAMRAFVFVVAFGFGDLMDRVLLMRVAQEPLPLVPKGLLPLALFLVLALCDAQVQALEASAPDLFAVVKLWHVLAACSVIIHQTFFQGAVRDLAKVLGIHPLRIKQRKD